MAVQAYKFRLYPTEDQAVLLEKHFGCVRKTYNWALDFKNKHYKETGKNIHWMKISSGDHYKEYKAEFPFLKEVNSQCLVNSIGNLDKAYKNFFEGRASFPKFKRKGHSESFQVPQWGKLDHTTSKLIIPKFTKCGGIKVKIHRNIPKGKHGTYTVSKTPSGKYFVSIIVHVDRKPLIKPIPNNAIGLDFGMKTFITDSNGHKITHPQFLKQSEKKIARAQRKYSKRKAGSKNKEKQRIKVAKIHEHIANQRNDFLHKLSYELICKNQADTICIENLNMEGMRKRWGKKISDLSWFEFTRMLEYKAEWYGKNLIKIGRFDPSSKMCSNCGNTNKQLELNHRTWTCESCNVTHDRDINAAINIKDFGMNQYQLPTERGNVKPMERKALTKKPMRKYGLKRETGLGEVGKVHVNKHEANASLDA